MTYLKEHKHIELQNLKYKILYHIRSKEYMRNIPLITSLNLFSYKYSWRIIQTYVSYILRVLYIHVQTICTL